MKELKCSDLGNKCDFVAKGLFNFSTKMKMKRHGMKAHGEMMQGMTEEQKMEMKEKMDELLSK